MITGRVNYTSEVEGKINNLIWMFMSIERTYKGLNSLVRGNEELQTLVGFSEFITFLGLRVTILGQKLMKYQVMRGGEVRFEQTKTFLPIPHDIVEVTPRAMIKTLEVVLESEKQLEQGLRELFFLAKEKKDIMTIEVIEARFIPAQLRMIRFVVGLLNNLIHSGNQQYMHDRLTFKPIVLTLGRLIESGELEKLSLVFQDKMVMMLLQTTWIQIKSRDSTLNETMDSKVWGTVSGPWEPKYGSDYTLVTDFFSF